MSEDSEARMKSRILTIPNLLSFFRLCLIPVVVWAYCVRGDGLLTGVLLLVSGATDVVDGAIARHFHMISDLGKVLDPVADKLTQTATLLCLLTRFRMMALPLGAMVVKEVYMGISGLMVVKKTGVVLGANWHGKAATVLLYAVMFLHVVWAGMPKALSDGAILACALMILLSFALYVVRNTKAMRGERV